MDVTVDNFFSVLEDFKTNLRDVAFVAFDLEFTGLNISKTASKLSRFDLVEERFEKAKESVVSFLPIQFGVCLFTPSTEGFVCRPYNFSIFARPQPYDDATFLCQSTSIEFLRDKGFDFNKWIHKGISFLSKEEEKKAREARKFEGVPIIPGQRELQFLSDIETEIRKWLKSPLSNSQTAPPPLTLKPANSFLRRLTRQELQKTYGNSIWLETITTTEGDAIKITKTTNDEYDKFAQCQESKKEETLKSQVGFRYVIDALIEAKKPLVGHNCFFDILHLHHRFVEPITDWALDEFCSKCLRNFPYIFDTRYLASNVRRIFNFPLTGLEQLYQTLSSKFTPVNTIFPENYDKYAENGSSFHEAAYDAFATGYIFISLIQQIDKKRNEHSDDKCHKSFVEILQEILSYLKNSNEDEDKNRTDWDNMLLSCATKLHLMGYADELSHLSLSDLKHTRQFKSIFLLQFFGKHKHK